MSTPPRYALLTKVLDPRHTLILEDWLDFLRHPPDELVVYVGGDPEISRRIDGLTRRSQLRWRAIPMAAGDDLSARETPILLRMVAATECEYLLFVTLDALPYRKPAHDHDWLREVFHRLRTEERVFFSACGLSFRGDRREDGGKYIITQRFSNNCGLLPREFWLRVMTETYPESATPPWLIKHHSEWAIEETMRVEGRFGLRRVETADWRVFHVQQWDARLFKTRERFRRGAGIERYLNRVWEDLPYEEAEFYNYPAHLRVKGRLKKTIHSIRRWVRRRRRS